MYDHVINTLILVADLGILWIMYRSEARRSRTRTMRRFNRILKLAGIR